MATKLHIDVTQGVIDIEGDPELVREIYRDMKERLLSNVPPYQLQKRETAAPASDGESRPKTKRRAASRKKAESDSGSSGISADAPKLDKNLDTAKLGAFYGQFEPKNNAEKILIFLKFIVDELGQDAPNTDQVYTCYKKAGDKIPKAFAQAFYDTGSKHGYIDFNSATDITITIAGDNHFNHAIKKKVPE